MGAAGSIINHTEKKAEFNSLVGAIAQCRLAGMKSVVCVNSVEEARAILSLKPDYLSLEYADLIGSGRSISALRPKDVEYFCGMIERSGNGTKPMCGAGISSGADVKAALELGSAGVLVASAIVNAADPEAVIMEMAEAMSQKAASARQAVKI